MTTVVLSKEEEYHRHIRKRRFEKLRNAVAVKEDKTSDLVRTLWSENGKIKWCTVLAAESTVTEELNHVLHPKGHQTK